MRYIGVDLHKTNFVVCFLSEDDQTAVETFTLDPKGLARFKRRLQKQDKLAVEASANAFYFCRQIKGRVGEITVVDTYRFAVIARSKSKTDKKDAAALARFLKLGCLPEVTIPSEQIQQLRHLLSAREGVVRMLTQLALYQKPVNGFTMIESIPLGGPVMWDVIWTVNSLTVSSTIE